MSDLNGDDLEFEGCTLQLLNEDNISINKGKNISNRKSLTSQDTINPSVLSGEDSLTTSSSFTDAEGERNGNTTETVNTVYPRYDVPFSRETIKDFFTFRNGVVDHAIQECVTALLFPEDGELIGTWLLTEISLWDNEKERIIILTSKLLMTIKYDFIALKQLDFKKTLLTNVDTVVLGELVYPPSSLVPERNLRGIRLMWNKGQPLSIKTMWNPFSQDIPFLTFASHPVYWHKDGDGVEERAKYDMEVFAQKLMAAIEDISPSSEILNSPIVIQSYLGVTSLLHNKNSLGFFKVRGKFSF